MTSEIETKQPVVRDSERGRPELRLPPRSVSSRRGGSGSSTIVVVLLLAVLGLQIWIAFRGASLSDRRAGMQTATTARHDSAVDKTIAMRLEERNLPAAAADAWERYLSGVALKPAEEAAVHYRIGKSLELAERYESAIDAFYRAEALLGKGAEGEMPRQITLHVRDCLRRLGQYADLTREMAQRANMSGEDASLSGRQVVAEIGGEKITVADFDRMVTEQIEQMISLQVGISPAEADRIRRQAHAQLSDPKAKAEQLQQLVAARVLADESRERGLEDSEAFRRQLSDFSDRLLATTLMLDEVGKRSTVTEQDVQRFFQANRDRYATPATVSIGHILVATEADAREVLAKALGGGAFGELAKEFSQDASTADKAGLIAQPMSESGDSVPGVGRNAELHAAIMGAPVDTVLVNPYESEAGWHVVKVVDRTERTERAFDDVREQVERDVRAARRQEVTAQYLRELFDSRKVKLYPEAFAASAGDSDASDDSNG